MNFAIFSNIGYISVALWASMPLLWLLHWVIRPRRWLCHLALIAGIAALACAKINSADYVDNLQEDKSEQIAAAQKAIEEARLRKQKERAEDVADVHFMEDDRGDFLDEGGMDEADRAYYKDETPEWKKEKQKRNLDAEDNSLENMIGGVEAVEGVDTTTLESEKKPAPIILPVKDYAMALRLDAVNHKVIRILILLANIGDSLPAIQERKPKPRRSVPQELKVIAKRGDTFIYLTDSAEKTAKLPQKLSRLPLGFDKMEVLPTCVDGQDLSSDFVFDALWFGRCSFTIDTRERADALLVRFIELLKDRDNNRSQADHTVHLVWDFSEPPSEVLKHNISVLGPKTGFSLFICDNEA